MKTSNTRGAEKRPLRWMKVFLLALVVGGVVLVVSWVRAPAGDVEVPLAKEPAQNKAPAAP